MEAASLDVDCVGGVKERTALPAEEAGRTMVAVRDSRVEWMRETVGLERNVTSPETVRARSEADVTAKWG